MVILLLAACWFEERGDRHTSFAGGDVLVRLGSDEGPGVSGELTVPGVDGADAQTLPVTSPMCLDEPFAHFDWYGAPPTPQTPPSGWLSYRICVPGAELEHPWDHDVSLEFTGLTLWEGEEAPFTPEPSDHLDLLVWHAELHDDVAYGWAVDDHWEGELLSETEGSMSRAYSLHHPFGGVEGCPSDGCTVDGTIELVWAGDPDTIVDYRD